MGSDDAARKETTNMYVKNKIELLEKLENRLNLAEKCKEKFVEDFNKNPEYALQWSQGIFEKAAEISVPKETIFSIKNTDATLEKIINYFQRKAANHAVNPSFSTSVTHNLIHVYRGAEFARLAEEFSASLL